MHSPRSIIPEGCARRSPTERLCHVGVSKLPKSFETLEAHSTTPSMPPSATDNAAMEVVSPRQVPFPRIMETVFEGCVIDSSVTSSNFVAMLDAGHMAHVSLWSTYESQPRAYVVGCMLFFVGSHFDHFIHLSFSQLVCMAGRKCTWIRD